VRYAKSWDAQIQSAVKRLFRVDQPLQQWLDPSVMEQAQFSGFASRSIRELYCAS